MPDKLDVTIIIPAYNEEEGITDIITQLKELSGNYEILVVDEGSTDKTYNLATDIGVKVIRHPYNKGYGAAQKTGIRNATADVVLFMDVDGQHQASDIKKNSCNILENMIWLLVRERKNQKSRY